MMQVLECPHGLHGRISVCYAKQCKFTSRMSYSCEECVESHTHNGKLLCKRFETISNEALQVGEGHKSDKTQQFCARAGTILKQIENITDKVLVDMNESAMGSRLPSSNAQLRRFEQSDKFLVGREVAKLLGAIDSGNISQLEGTMDERGKRIELEYDQFITKIDQIIAIFVENRNRVLKGPTKRKEVVKQIPRRTQQQPQQQRKVAFSTAKFTQVSQKASKNNIQAVSIPKQQPKRAMSIVRRETPVTLNEEYWPSLNSQPTRKEPSNKPKQEAVRLQWRTPTLKFINVTDIQPNDEGLNIVVKVVSAVPHQTRKGFLKCVLGDETGIVSGSLLQHQLLVRGNVLEMTDLRAFVNYKHLILNTTRASILQLSNRAISKVNDKRNISVREWQEGSIDMPARLLNCCELVCPLQLLMFQDNHIWECSHGTKGQARICDSPDCSVSALACINCPECFEVHEHDGTLRLRKASAFSQIADPKSGTSSSTKIAGMVALTTQIVNSIQTQDIDADIKQLNSRRSFNSTVERFINSMSKPGEAIVGSEVAELICCIKQEDIFSKDCATDTRISKLQEAYQQFFSSVRNLLEGLQAETRRVITSKPKLKEIHIMEPTQRAPKYVLKQPSKPVTIPKQPSKPLKPVAQRYVLVSSKPSTFISRTSENQPDWDDIDISSMSSSSKDSQKELQKQVIKFTKIGDIGPKQSNLNLLGTVLKVYYEKTETRKFVRCLIGDESGTVWCSFPDEKIVQEKATLELRNVKSLVLRKYGSICINTTSHSTIRRSLTRIDDIDKVNNISNDRFYGEEWW